MSNNLAAYQNPHPTKYQQDWHQHLWAEETFFDSNDEFFQQLFADLGQAHSNIVLATYIFMYDQVGKQMIDVLANARKRGVKVRVLFDGFGSFETAGRVAQALADSDIQVRIFHPLPWQTENYRFALRRKSPFSNFIGSFLKLNQRHHGKVTIIDNQTMWSGSANVCEQHLSKASGGNGWHDYGVRVTGKAVQEVADLFEDFWYYRKPKFGRGVFRHHWNNLTSITRRRKNRLLTRKMLEAQELIWIVNPYFSPTGSVLRALRKAGQRGVDVRLIVPNKSDIGFFPLLTSTYYDALIKASVRVFEYLPAVLHAKLLLIDDFRLVGSTNLNHRSLLHDIEFDVVMDSEQSREKTRRCFLRDQEQSREVTSKDLQLLGWRRLLGWLPWLLRYWL